MVAILFTLLGYYLYYSRRLASYFKKNAFFPLLSFGSAPINTNVAKRVLVS